MRAYDFDKTIYDGDSTVDFYFYALKKCSKVILKVPSLIWFGGLYILGIIKKGEFKEKFYSFLTKINDIDGLLNEFWNEKQKKIKKFYIDQKEDDDVIISASSEFLLKPICDRLGVENLIASIVDKKTGKSKSPNCYGSEKTVRFREKFGDKNPDEFYSDSLSDKPMAEISKKSYIVDKNKLIDWNEYEKNKFNNTKASFFTRDFLAFLFVGTLNTVNGIVFSFLYSLILQTNVAFILGYITSLCISYVLNSIITFKEKFSFMKFVKFCISYIPNFLIQNLFVIVFYNILGINKLIVFIMAAILGIPITFIIMKFFAFK